jgi:hypothetical protein
MFGVVALVPASQTQSTGLPWWVWLLLLVIVIVVFIWLQRRSEAKKAPPAEVKASEPAPTVEAPPVPEAAAATRTVEPVAPAAVTEMAPAEPVAVATPPKPASRPWKSSAWRTREWQPQSPAWYPKWKYRRPKAG